MARGGLPQFHIDLANFERAIHARPKAAVKKIALELHRSITQKTPVDTGRLRASTMISVGKPAEGEWGETGWSAGQAESNASRASSSLASLSTYELGDTIHITNNVAYAGYVEHGTDRTEPVNMFKLSFEEAKTSLGDFLT